MTRPRPARGPHYIFALTVSTAIPSTAHAATRYFVGPDNGSWSDPANWSATNGGAGGAGVPGNADFAILTRNGPILSSKTAKMDALYGAATSLAEVRLYDTGFGTFTLALNVIIIPLDPPLILFPHLRANNEYIGYGGGQGSVNHIGGLNTVKFNLQLGGDAGSAATYNLSGGTLTTGNALVVAGPATTFNHSGGTHDANSIFLGSSAGAGTYNLSGSAVLNVAGVFYVGSDGGAGHVSQTGGTFSDGNLNLGDPTKPADATYSLSAGTLAAAVTIGTTGKTATFTQSGGVAVLGALNINDPGPSGAAAYNLQAGALTCNTVQNHATFNQTGGSLKINSGVIFDNYGTATLGGSAQDWGLNSSLRGRGTSVTHVNLDLGGGAAFPNVNAADAASVNLNRSQRLNLLGTNGNATVTLTPSPNKNRAIYAANGLIIESNATATARIDLTNNGLIIHSGYSAPATRAQLVRGYHNGDWQGPGITSSTAAADPAKNTALGYFVNDATYTTFQGMNVVPGDILVRYTLYGDANLDAVVDFNDLVKLAQNYNTASGHWFQGDFNYDGTVDFNDLVKLAQNYNAALPAASIPGAPAGLEADVARALAAVPEPAAQAAAMLSAGCCLAVRRRRRGWQ